LDDDFAWVDSFFPIRSFSVNGQFVNTDEYDVMPKQSTIDRRLKENEKEAEEVDKLYENRKKRLQEEKDELLRLRK